MGKSATKYQWDATVVADHPAGWTFKITRSPVGDSVGVFALMYAPGSTMFEPRSMPTGDIKVDLREYVHPPTWMERFMGHNVTFQSKVDDVVLKLERIAAAECKKRDEDYRRTMAVVTS